MKTPVDHVTAQRERLKKRSEEGKSESHANEARERHGGACTRAPPPDSANTSVTRRQTGVISLTQAGAPPARVGPGAERGHRH